MGSLRADKPSCSVKQWKQLSALTASSLSVCKSGRRTHEGAISMHTTSSGTANQNSAVKLIMRAAAAAAKVDTDNGQATVPPPPLVKVFTSCH